MICLETIEEEQSAVVGNMTVAETVGCGEDRDKIYKDISQKVMERTSVYLNKMGISLISYVVKDIGRGVNILSNILVLKLMKYF